MTRWQVHRMATVEQVAAHLDRLPAWQAAAVKVLRDPTVPFQFVALVPIEASGAPLDSLEREREQALRSMDA